MSTQIALPLTIGGTDDAVRMVIGQANRIVIEALSKPSEWPFCTAVLTGPRRSGKSMLGSWMSKAGVTVIDGADEWEEDQLFYRWNRAQEDGTPLLLIANSQPWEIELADLKSRLGGSMQLEIEEIDDVMAGHLVEAIAQQRGLILPEGATHYLVPRMVRSFADVERLVIAIDRLSLERKVPATMSLWRDALEAIQGPDQARLL